MSRVLDRFVFPVLIKIDGSKAGINDVDLKSLSPEVH